MQNKKWWPLLLLLVVLLAGACRAMHCDCPMN